jgi:hypothetical protein
MDKLLNTLYYKEKNYDGIEVLYRKAKLRDSKITRKMVKEWLTKQATVQQTKRKVEKREFLPIYSETPESFQIDLTFIPKYKKQNNGFYVLFTAINITTRFAYVYYSKDKNVSSIMLMMKQFHNDTNINSLAADQGSEYTNKTFTTYCEKNNIDLYIMKADSHKLGIINRFHRTLKEKLLKHSLANNSVVWINDIDNIVKNYNNSFHKGIGIEPANVDKFIASEIIDTAKIKTAFIKGKEILFKIGDTVRVKQDKTVFNKQVANFSNITYKVVKINKNSLRLDNDTLVKKSNVLVVNEIENEVKVTEKPKAEKDGKVDRRINKEGIERNDDKSKRILRKKPKKQWVINPLLLE